MNRRSRNQQIEQVLRSAGIYQGHWTREASIVTRAAGEKSTDGYLWTMTSELPATVFDWDRWDFVEEVLLMDGMLTPAIGQVPLLDAHNRHSVDDVLGHVRDFAESTAGQYAARDGKVFFAADDKSKRTEQKVVDRHLLDGSVGYQVLKSVWIPEGEEAAIGGKIFQGPLKVSYSWLLKEFSVTPVGADVLAKVRTLCDGGRQQNI